MGGLSRIRSFYFNLVKLKPELDSSRLKMSLSSHQKTVSGTDTWLTPPEILHPLGEFDLDPCAVAGWNTAKRHIILPEDGLAAEWAGRVWMNPPFGRACNEWMRKMAKHGNGIVLIPARTETRIFYETVWGVADAVLFLKGRPHFHFPDGKRAPFGTGSAMCLIAYGHGGGESWRNESILRASGLGHTVSAL